MVIAVRGWGVRNCVDCYFLQTGWYKFSEHLPRRPFLPDLFQVECNFIDCTHFPTLGIDTWRSFEIFLKALKK